MMKLENCLEAEAAYPAALTSKLKIIDKRNGSPVWNFRKFYYEQLKAMR